jgi:hypothetical protein
MRISTSISKIFLPVLLAASASANAQKDSTKFLKRLPEDTSKVILNMEANYDRPFVQPGKLPIAIGGYMETNTEWSSTDGVSEGTTFQFRRVSIFLYSTIADRITFLSEIEFENGGEDIDVEYASLDFNLTQWLNLRGGIIVNPIGSFNQNHDGPKWDFVDRPLEATTILPATLSTAGFGVYGKYALGNWVLGYEAYITGGFDDSIIGNADGRTSLADGLQNPERFVESNNGSPMFTGKIAMHNRNVGEFGLSYMGGVYNSWQNDGLVIDNKRRMGAVAVDYTTSLLNKRLNITGEVAEVFVNIPTTALEEYGSKQWGIYTDFVGTIIKRPILRWNNAKIDLAMRVEYVDYNDSYFREGGRIYDDLWSIVPAIAFRPVGTTVIRFNYRYQQQRDMLGNHLSPFQTAAFQLGFSTYF